MLLWLVQFAPMQCQQCGAASCSTTNRKLWSLWCRHARTLVRFWLGCGSTSTTHYVLRPTFKELGQLEVARWHSLCALGARPERPSCVEGLPGDVFHLRRLRQCPCDDVMFLWGERRRHVKAPGQCTIGGKWSQSEGWQGLAKRHLKTGSIQMGFMAGGCQEMQSDWFQCSSLLWESEDKWGRMMLWHQRCTNSSSWQERGWWWVLAGAKRETV